MTTYIAHPLSASDNGRPIEVNATASPGTEIHTVQATARDAIEQVEVYAVNVGGGAAELTIELGATETTDHLVDIVQPRQGPRLMVPGLCFTATTSVIRAFATTTGLFHIVGSVRPAA